MRVVDLEQRVLTSGRLSFVTRDETGRHFYGDDRDRNRGWAYRLTLDGAWTYHRVEQVAMLETSTASALARVSEREVVVVANGVAYRVTGATIAEIPLAIDTVRTLLLRERDDLTGMCITSATADSETATLAITSSYREPVSTGALGLPYHESTTHHRFSTRTGALEVTLPEPPRAETPAERVRRIVGPDKGLWTEIDPAWSDGDAAVAVHTTRGKSSATISYVVGDRAVLVRKRLERKGSKDHICLVKVLRDGFLYSTSDGIIGRFRDGAFEHLATEIYAPSFHDCGDELYVFSPGNRVYQLEL